MFAISELLRHEKYDWFHKIAAETFVAFGNWFYEFIQR